MTYDAALRYDAGRDIRNEAHMVKMFGDTQSFVAADRCMTIHGGTELTADLPIEKFWRDQRSMMIISGAPSPSPACG
jgi:acyl-CoA dehydrogenase